MNTENAVSAFIRTCVSRNLSPRTISWYTCILHEFSCMYCNELPCKAEECENFILSCKAGDERKHGYYRALRALYNYAERRLDINMNPMRHVDPPRRKRKLPRPITPLDIASIWNQDMPPEVRAAIRFFTDTGARLSECHNLKKTDLFEMPWGYAARIDGKTGERLIPISCETYNRLLEVLPFRYSTDWLGRKISAVFKSAGVKGGAHNIRHTFGTYWDGPLDTLQMIMGHSTISTTMLYRSVRMESIAMQHHEYTPARTMLLQQGTML